MPAMSPLKVVTEKDRKLPEEKRSIKADLFSPVASGPFYMFFLKIYRLAVFFLSFSDGHTVRIMVMKQAAPPMKLEMGSARNTP